MEMTLLSPSLALPRKRGREGTEHAAPKSRV